MSSPKGLLGRLIQSLGCLPGVGPKTAQRMAFHLLQKNRPSAQILANTLLEALNGIQHCEQCRTLTEHKLCEICSDTNRDQSVMCIVENPSDVWAIEQAGFYRGSYFVLHGRLSPLDGIGPDELGFNELETRFSNGNTREIILATNLTVEGEATAFFINELAKKHGLQASRIAQGVPVGGELEYIDGGTLSHAFSGRKKFS